LIGVLAHESDYAVVEEFFELFKTPWELCRSGRRYPVVLSAKPEAPVPEGDLVVIYESNPAAARHQNGRREVLRPETTVLNYRGKRLPIYRGCSSLHGMGSPIITQEDNGQPVGIAMTGRGSMMVRIGFDLFREVRHLLVAGQPVQYAGVPTLEIHIAILRDLIVESGLPLAEIPPVPPGRDFILCLTHDVDFAGIRFHRLDRTVLGFIRRATLDSLERFLKGDLTFRKLARNIAAVASLPLVYAGLAHDFLNQLDEYPRLEGDLQSTFFIVPQKDLDGFSPDERDSEGRATRYDVEDVRREVSLLLYHGDEVGLHGIDAWHDHVSAEEERRRIRQATASDVTGVRMHWLYYGEHSPNVLEQAGFSYDSTSGYNDAIGFRNGIAQVFRPLGVDRLLELPLHIQDTALFSKGRMALTQDDGMNAIDEVVGKIRETGGVLTVNWHCRSLGPERFWDDPYGHLLRHAKQGIAWAATAQDVVEWFALRRSAKFSEVDLQQGKIRISCAGKEGSPGLLLRVHNVPAGPQTRTSNIPFSGNLTFTSQG
jgi:hypothetical protein